MESDRSASENFRLTSHVVRQAYLYLKSYAYHENLNFFLKQKIAEFECDPEFDDRISKLAGLLARGRISQGRKFKGWLEDVSYRILPKSVSDPEDKNRSRFSRAVSGIFSRCEYAKSSLRVGIARLGDDAVKKASRQKLFTNMLHEFTTVAEGVRPPSEPGLKNARLKMAIKAIGRIKEKDSKFRDELEDMDGLGSDITGKLDKCRETADILQTHLLQCLYKRRREIKEMKLTGISTGWRKLMNVSSDSRKNLIRCEDTESFSLGSAGSQVCPHMRKQIAERIKFSPNLATT